MALNVCVNYRALQLAHALASLGRNVEVVADDAVAGQVANDFVVTFAHGWLHSVLFREDVADQGRNALCISRVLMMRGHLPQHKLARLVDFGVVEHERDVHHDEDHVGLLKVVICGYLGAHEGAGRVRDVHTQRVKLLVPALHSREHFEAHLRRVHDFVLL